jgi:hypothetical protein
MKYILSIDWDYFMVKTKKQVIRCPDGGNENLPGSVSDFIWLNCYSGSPELLDIKTNIASMRALGRTLKLNKGYSKFKVAKSHADIYPFICENIDDPFEPITIVNIDEHHDFYDHIDELNCGNWAWHVFDNFELKKFIWYQNDHASIVGKPPKEPCIEIIRDDNLRGIQDCFYDMVFICKSLPWSPPHLDKNFEKFFKNKIPESAYIEGVYNGTFDDRFKKIKPAMNSYSQMLKQFSSTTLSALPGVLEN